MAAGTIIPLEEYLSTAYDPDVDYVDGELIERNMGEPEHSALQGIIYRLLYERGAKSGLHVYLEVRVQVSATRFRVPDVAATKEKAHRHALSAPPLLCVEILSPEDRVSRLESRIDDYLELGVQYIWLIDPEARRAWVYDSEHKREPVAILTAGDMNISLSLEEIFHALDAEVED